MKISNPPIEMAVARLPVKTNPSTIVSTLAINRQVAVLVAERRRPSRWWPSSSRERSQCNRDQKRSCR